MAIAFASENHNDIANNTVLVITMSPTIATGDTVYVSVTSAAGANHEVVSVVDSGGSAYTLQDSNATQEHQELWATVSAVASTTVTVTISAVGGNTSFGAIVARYSGGSSFGNHNNNQAVSGTKTDSVTTQDNNNFVITGFYDEGGGAATVTNGNARVNRFFSNQSSFALSLYDNTAGTPGSVTNSYTNTSTQFGTASSELRLAAGAPNVIGSFSLTQSGGMIGRRYI